MLATLVDYAATTKRTKCKKATVVFKFSRFKSTLCPKKRSHFYFSNNSVNN